MLFLWASFVSAPSLEGPAQTPRLIVPGNTLPVLPVHASQLTADLAQLVMHGNHHEGFACTYTLKCNLS